MQIILERFVIVRTALRTADAVETNGQPVAAEAREQFRRNRDAFRVRAGLACAKELHAELVVFAQSARLRTFIAKRRAIEIKHLRRLGFGKKVVLHKHPNHARRAFRLEGDGTLAFVEEGVHLLLHDVRRFSNAAQEKLRMLKNGCAYL